MTSQDGRSAPGGAGGGLRELVRSADFARAYTLTVFAAVLGAHLIERLSGQVTLISVTAALAAIGVAVLAARREEISFLRLVPTTLLLFISWALVSVFWSFDPLISFGRWLAMLAVALLAVTIGHIRDTLQTVRALGDVARVALTLSLALEILSGILLDRPLSFLGIQGNLAELGPVQGIFGTRNLLGIVAIIALITFIVEHRAQSVRPGVAVYSITLGCVMALLSASPTVFVLAVAVGAATGALALIRRAPAHRRRAAQWTLAGIVAVGLSLVYAQRTQIIEAVGASDDLSMRTDLWSVVDFYARVRPVQGWGWYGAWAPEEQPFATINLILREQHTTALNAFVDTLLQLGWAGVALICAFGGVALVRSWLDASERRSIVYAWTPLLLITLAASSLFESFILFGAGWLLLVLAAVRAGQSRSWRKRMDSSGPDSPGLEHVPG